MVVNHSCSCLLSLKGVMATDVLTASSAVPHDEGGVANPRPVSLEHTGNGGEGRVKNVWVTYIHNWSSFH